MSIEKYVKNLSRLKVKPDMKVDEVFDARAIRAGVGVWGVINLLEGYGNDNPGTNAHVR